jgi:DNA recombination-dependent growth factor C
MLRNIKCQDKVLELAKDNYGETEEERFNADFVRMTEILTKVVSLLIKNLLGDLVQ